MIIDFTEEEKSLILNLIERYENMNSEWMKYKKEADEIQAKLNDIDIRLKAAKKEEDKLISSLKEKYGEFGLMDIHEILQRNEQRQ